MCFMEKYLGDVGTVLILSSGAIWSGFGSALLMIVVKSLIKPPLSGENSVGPFTVINQHFLIVLIIKSELCLINIGGHPWYNTAVV